MYNTLSVTWLVSSSGVFETQSISLYALLVDSNYNTIDSSKFRIENSTVSGWLKIPDSILHNNYKVLAFTSTMANYDPEFVFTTQIRVRDSIPNTDTKSRINDNTLPYYQSLTKPEIDLRFLPEGGTFITGVPQRLAFNAVSFSGKTLHVKGVIKNQKGEEIIEFESGKYGPGMIEFIPKEGDRYFAHLTDSVHAGIKSTLPVPKNYGPALRVSKISKALLDIKVEGKPLDPEPYYLSVTKNLVPVYTGTINPDSLFIVRLNFEELPAGTLFVSLYDKDFNSIAERLVFINEQKTMNITVSSTNINDTEVELTLNTSNESGKKISSFLSIAVIDSATGYFDKYPVIDMEASYLYDKDFYNNLPLDIKREGLSNINQNSLDLLLMTYGWRTFNLKKIQQSDSVKELINYDFIKIKNPGAKLYTREDFIILALEDLDSISLQNNKDGGATLYYDSLKNYVKQILILPDKKRFKNFNPIKVTHPEINSFVYKAKRVNRNVILPKGRKLTSYYLESDTSVYADQEIEEIIIQTRTGSKTEYVNKFEELFQNTKVNTYTKKDFEGCGTFEDMLIRSNPYNIDLVFKIVHLKNIHRSIMENKSPAIFIIDGQLLHDYVMIANMPISQIESMSVLNGIQGYGIYGQDAVGGVVYVTTKEDTKGNSNNLRNNDLMRPIRLFRSEIEFYSPTKEELIEKPEYQFRPTILWNRIFLDGKGPVILKIPGSLTKGRAMVFINGVSNSNMIGSESHIFNIK